MEMYEKMRHEEKINLNRQLEEDIKQKTIKNKNSSVEENNIETKKKIEEIFDKFEFIKKIKILILRKMSEIRKVS